MKIINCIETVNNTDIDSSYQQLLKCFTPEELNIITIHFFRTKVQPIPGINNIWI